jgi:hypothetical protein
MFFVLGVALDHTSTLTISKTILILILVLVYTKEITNEKEWIQHHTVPGWSPTPVLSGLKPR